MNKSTCCQSKVIHILDVNEDKVHLCSKCLGVVQLNKKSYLKYFSFAIVLTLLFCCIKTSEQGLHITNKIKQPIPALTIENLKKELLSDSVLHPSVVLCQALLETGNFTSPVCRKGHNLFGLKYIGNAKDKCRETTAIGEFQGHARYNNWLECVKDYKLWQTMYLKNGDDEYIKLLEKMGYAEADNYSSSIHEILKEQK